MAVLSPRHERALVDGVVSPLHRARLSLTDPGVARGDGAFETVGVWDGRPFRLDDHLERLDASLAALALPPAPRQALRDDCAVLLEGVDADAALRVAVTAGGTRVASLSALPDRPPLRVLVPQPAPWIQPVEGYHASGAKSLSYGPNMVAGRLAQREGGDDALLVSVPGGLVLEGPTFGVVFVARGVVHVPDPALGIVNSISRRTLLEVAAAHDLDVLVGRWPSEVLADADEVITSSALRPAVAVERVGPWTYGRHPVTDLLNEGLRARRRG